MKNLILLLSFILISASFSFSQSPQAFKYQSVVRDAAGEILDNQLVSFRIGIRDVSAVGTLLYQETFTLTTNQFGLATFEVGNGIPEPGSGLFADIDWEINSKFLEIELDPDGGNTYSLMGTSQILSVPYAMYADTAGYSEDTDWILTGDDMYANIPGNVGIGTQNPVTSLHVHGKGAFGNAVNTTKANRALNLVASDAVMRIWRTTDNTSFDPGVELIWGTQPTQGEDGNYWWDFFLKSSDGSFNIRDRSFGQGNATRLAIAPSGNVGLGTTTPNERLHVAGAMVIEDMVSGSLSDSLVLWDPIDSKLKVTSLAGLMGDNDWTLDGDTLYSASDSTLTIKDGNVGIGTSNPQGLLDLYNASGTARLNIDSDSGNGATINFDNNHNEKAAFIYDLTRDLKIINLDTDDNADIIFRVKENDEVLRLSANGNIGIGTTTPTAKAHIKDVLRLEPRDTFPPTPEEGDIFVHAIEHNIYCFLNGVWQQLNN